MAAIGTSYHLGILDPLLTSNIRISSLRIIQLMGPCLFRSFSALTRRRCQSRQGKMTSIRYTSQSETFKIIFDAHTRTHSYCSGFSRFQKVCTLAAPGLYAVSSVTVRREEGHRQRGISTVQTRPHTQVNCDNPPPTQTFYEAPGYRSLSGPILPACDLRPWAPHRRLSRTSNDSMDSIELVCNVIAYHLNPSHTFTDAHGC